MSKRVTRQTIIGERGIALIHQLVLDMGHLFHPRRVDHGIDGHIDLIDPASQTLLNSTILVQSKAHETTLPGETDTSFHYLLDRNDLDFWLAGNAPVILVVSRPDLGEAWWSDVKGAFPDARARATRRIEFNKCADRFDAAAGPRLLERGVSRERGLYLRPVPRPETLTSNLLPIQSLPPRIYAARTTAKTYPEAGDRLSGEARTRDAWMLRDGLVYSFADLEADPLQALCDGPVTSFDTTNWSAADEKDLVWRFTDLLQRQILSGYPQLRWHKERKHAHHLPSRDLTPIKIASGSGSRRRCVFGPHSDDGTGKPGYYSHAALDMRLRRLLSTWYAELQVDYCFTSDGYQEHPNADLLIGGIKRLDRHAAVRGWTKTWAQLLRGEDHLFAPDLPVPFGSLLELPILGGIDERYWGPAPESAAAEDDIDTASAPDSVDLSPYETDLLSLLEGEIDEVADDATQPGDAPDGTPAAKSRRGPRRATRDAGHGG